jgi:hypothetical protein
MSAANNSEDDIDKMTATELYDFILKKGAEKGAKIGLHINCLIKDLMKKNFIADSALKVIDEDPCAYLHFYCLIK